MSAPRHARSPRCRPAGGTACAGAWGRAGRGSRADSPAEWIRGIKMQRGFGGHIGTAANGRNDLALGTIAPPIAPLERAADDALLHPGLVLRKAAIGRETGELGAQARTAR